MTKLQFAKDMLEAEKERMDESRSDEELGDAMMRYSIIWEAIKAMEAKQ